MAKSIEQLQTSIKETKQKIALENDKVSKYNIKLAKLEDIKKQINNQISSLDEFKSKIETDLIAFGIDVNAIIKIETDYSLIDREIQLIKAQKNGSLEIIKKANGELEEDNNKLKAESDALNEPQKKYQKYLAELEDFAKRKLTIEGDKENPEPDTLNAYIKEKKYIQENLQNDIQTKRNEQINIAKQIYAQKKEIVDVFQHTKECIDEVIHENEDLLEGYSLEVSTSVSLSIGFNDKFLSYINQSKKGFFKGKLDGQKNLNSLLSEFDKNNIIEDNIEVLLNTLVSVLKDKENQIFIDDQIDDMIGFYNYLFSLDYLDTNYQLMQDNKDLKTLSPGEKGALLLVFYLLLDMDNKPLILDQPEDNLDNNSVAKILVKFIRKAKKTRQIIMVTHNPNLAVVADAEQVIKMDIEKDNKNKVNFKSGAIENPEINQCIVDVLEGTYKAFHNRDQKYMNKEF